MGVAPHEALQAITRTGHTSAWTKESLRLQGEVASISAKWCGVGIGVGVGVRGSISAKW